MSTIPMGLAFSIWLSSLIAWRMDHSVMLIFEESAYPIRLCIRPSRMRLEGRLNTHNAIHLPPVMVRVPLSARKCVAKLVDLYNVHTYKGYNTSAIERRHHRCTYLKPILFLSAARSDSCSATKRTLGFSIFLAPSLRYLLCLKAVRTGSGV